MLLMPLRIQREVAALLKVIFEEGKALLAIGLSFFFFYNYFYFSLKKISFSIFIREGETCRLLAFLLELSL